MSEQAESLRLHARALRELTKTEFIFFCWQKDNKSRKSFLEIAALRQRLKVPLEEMYRDGIPDFN